MRDMMQSAASCNGFFHNEGTEPEFVKEKRYGMVEPKSGKKDVRGSYVNL